MLTHDYRYETCLEGSVKNAWTVDDQRNDVLLDKGEDVAVAVAADLVEHPLLVVTEAADGVCAGDLLGQERLVEVEVPATEAVVHGPGLRHRTPQAGVIAVVMGQHRSLLGFVVGSRRLGPGAGGRLRRGLRLRLG